MWSPNFLDQIGSILYTFGIGVAESVLLVLLFYGILLLAFKRMKGNYYEYFDKLKNFLSKYSLGFLFLVIFLILGFGLIDSVPSNNIGLAIALVLFAILYKNILLDFGYGIICLFNKSLKVGDSVKICKTEGIVKEFKITHLVIKLKKGRDYQVPYSKLLKHGFVHIDRTMSCFPVLIVVDCNKYQNINKQILRDIALTSVYRVKSKQPKIYYLHQSLSFRIEFYTWDSQAVSEAQENYFNHLSDMKMCVET